MFFRAVQWERRESGTGDGGVCVGRSQSPREMGAVTTVSLRGAPFEAADKITALGLSLSASGGIFCLRAKQRGEAMGELLRRKTSPAGVPDPISGAVEVLACIPLKQPASLAKMEKCCCTENHMFLNPAQRNGFDFLCHRPGWQGPEWHHDRAPPQISGAVFVRNSGCSPDGKTIPH